MERQMGMTTSILAIAMVLAISVSVTAQAQNFDSFAPGSHQALRFEQESHASSRQNVAMLRLAHSRPEGFLGKMLTLNDGRRAGTIHYIRRNRDDKPLYLIIQAETYFKEDNPKDAV